MDKKTVIIIGGGFAGCHIAKSLEKRFNVILIDNKDYFEFTPGILRGIVEPEHLLKLQVKHKDQLKYSRFLYGNVSKVDFKNNIVIINKKSYKYDYLVIASGSKYTDVLKSDNIILASRGKILKESYDKLNSSDEILILGGGPVGVELASEILDKYKDKNLYLMTSNNRLLDRCNIKASKYSKKTLENNGAKIHLNETIIDYSEDKNIIRTNQDKEFKADIIFSCVGIRPNSSFISKKYLDQKGYFKVNNHLQMIGFSNVFAAGDITDIKEEKLAQAAEEQSRIVVKNLMNIEDKKVLVEYKSKPRITVISLGKRKGIIIYKNFSFAGYFPSLLKSLIEKRYMKK